MNQALFDSLGGSRFPPEIFFEARRGARERHLGGRRRNDEYSSSSEDDEYGEGMNGIIKKVVIGDEHDEGTTKTGDEKDELATPATSDSVQEVSEPGMACSVKNLYSGKEDKRGRYQWQETIPKNNKPVENAQTAKYALLVRNTKVYNNPRKTLSVHSIVIQSPLLKRLLQKVLKDYPGLSLNLRRLEFTGKFESLIHRWGRLQEEIAKLDDSSDNGRETKKHAELLFSVLKTEFNDVIDSSQDMMSKGVITFEHLWTIFQPASLIYTRQDGQDTALVSLNLFLNHLFVHANSISRSLSVQNTVSISQSLLLHFGRIT